MPGADPYVIVVERPRRRRWPWVLGAMATVFMVCCVTGAIAWAPIGKEYPAYLEVGDPVAGFDRVDNPDFRVASAEMVASMYRDHGVDDAVAAVLSDPKASGRLVILIGATKLFLNPAGALDKAIEGAAGNPLRDLTRYPDLPGHLTCANTVDDQKQPVVVCAWIDHGSIGLGIYYGTWTMRDCATKLRDIRDAVVRRGQRPQ
jgi:hypothetical protein